MYVLDAGLYHEVFQIGVDEIRCRTVMISMYTYICIARLELLHPLTLISWPRENQKKQKMMR